MQAKMIFIMNYSRYLSKILIVNRRPKVKIKILNEKQKHSI